MQIEEEYAGAIHHYKTQGFAHFKQLIPTSLTTDIKMFLVNEFEKLNRHCKQSYGVALTDANSVANAYQGNLAARAQAERFLFSGVYPTDVRLHPNVEQILHCKPLQELSKHLLNCDTLFAHVPVMSRYITPHSQTSAVPPHKDNQYNSHLTNFVTVWIPLVNIDSLCGGVNFYPNEDSSVKAPTKTKKQDDNYWHEPINVSQLPCVSPHLSVGDVLIFDPNIIHGSAPNNAEHIRYSLDIRLFSERDSSSKYCINLTTGERISPVEKK